MKPRRLYVLGILAAIALGLTSRYVPLGFRFWDLDLGDIVSGTAAYFLLACFFPRASFVRKTIYATIFCVAVECFKLTGIPLAVRHIAPLRWLLGTSFSLHNIPLYILGIGGGAWVDWKGPQHRLAEGNSSQPVLALRR